MNKYLAEFLQFMQDLPFAQVGTAAEGGFTNVVLDVQAGEAIAMAAVKDFFSGNTTAAPAHTAAAITNTVAAGS